MHQGCKFANFVGWKNMNTRINRDFFGMVTSVACAVLPLLISSLPIFGINIVNNPLFEWLMIAIAFVVGAYAVLHGFWRHHKSLLPFFLFSGGFMFLVIKQIFHHLEIYFLVPAVILILYAHFLNYRYTTRINR